jgi:LPXTG-motif cell wall-anchored protein
MCGNNGKCTCYQGWKGEDCGTPLSIPGSNDETPNQEDRPSTGSNNQQNYFAMLLGAGLVFGILWYAKKKNARRAEQQNDNYIEMREV